ncbi:MAG: SpoVR family protein [Candidatus Brocadiales bacterium]|nr:SpoVR family protein [Candidatus Brocadiales bacterium]
MRKNNLLFTDNEWTFESLDRIWKAIEKIAHEDYNLDYYEPQFDIITSEQMMDAYSHIDKRAGHIPCS